MQLLVPHARAILREHNPSVDWTRVLVWGASALALGVLISATSLSFSSQAIAAPKKKTPTPLPGTQGSTGPSFEPVEPPEGWVSRWESRRAQAVRRCQLDAMVTTLPQMIRCALVTAFPEAGTWDEMPTLQWMRDAQTRAQTDLQATIEATYPGPVNGWKTALWLQGERIAMDCANASPAKTAACIALTLYPDQQWPPRKESEQWQREFYYAVLALVGMDLATPGLVGSTGA